MKSPANISWSGRWLAGQVAQRAQRTVARVTDSQNNVKTFAYDGLKRKTDMTGLHNFEIRLYDGLHSRFSRVDPLAMSVPLSFLEIPQKLNPYSYGQGRPTVLVDPTGMFSVDRMVDALPRSLGVSLDFASIAPEGAAVTFSVGIGFFPGTGEVGWFTSAGASRPSDWKDLGPKWLPFMISPSPWVSNAREIGDLSKTRTTTLVGLGFGLIGGSGSYSRGDNIWQAGLSGPPIPSFSLGFGGVQHETDTRSHHLGSIDVKALHDALHPMVAVNSWIMEKMPGWVNSLQTAVAGVVPGNPMNSVRPKLNMPTGTAERGMLNFPPWPPP